MPFKSQAQRRYFHWMAGKGEISPKVVHEWEHATKDKKDLPEHVKQAGGPGSGVMYNNTSPIAAHELKRSPVISLGHRQKIKNNCPCTVEDVSVDDITHASQDNYVPNKLNKILDAMEKGKLDGKPVDLLKLDDDYHVVDGHHRVMAAKRLKKDRIKARVYTLGKEAEMEKKAFWVGFEKRASLGHVAEIAGLGTLAAPTIQKMRGKPMSEKNTDRTELAGLGVLAAPSAVAIGKKVFDAGRHLAGLKARLTP